MGRGTNRRFLTMIVRGSQGCVSSHIKTHHQKLKSNNFIRILFIFQNKNKQLANCTFVLNVPTKKKIGMKITLLNQLLQKIFNN